VGMTRARRRLHLTHARTRMIRGREQLVGPSRFLDELPEEGVERESFVEESKAARSANLFAQQAEQVARKKRKVRPRRGKPVLEVLEGSADGSLAEGCRVRHPSYGEGVVVGVDSAGKHHMVRVEFPQHGVLTLLISAG